VTLAKTIEVALWGALERHVQSAYGTVAQVIPANALGQPVKVSGFFFIENVCREVADMLVKSGMIKDGVHTPGVHNTVEPESSIEVQE
jgi:hypothetical protein